MQAPHWLVSQPIFVPARQIQLFTQKMDQQGAGVDIAFMRDPVYSDCDLHKTLHFACSLICYVSKLRAPGGYPARNCNLPGAKTKLAPSKTAYCPAKNYNLLL